MNTKENLQKMLDGYQRDDSWTQRSMARVGERSVSLWSGMHERPTCWCLSGMAAMATGDFSFTKEPYRNVMEALGKALNFNVVEKGWVSAEARVQSWNDANGRTIEQVRDLIRKAIGQQDA